MTMIALLWTFASVRVDVTPPSRPDCPSAEAIARDIQTLIGDEAEVDVRLEVRDDAGSIVADVTYGSPGRTHSRSIPGSTCADVMNAAAVVVAVGTDPVAVHHTLAPILQRPSQVSEPSPNVEAPPVLPVAGDPAPEQRPRSPTPPPRTGATRRPSLRALLRGGVGVGALPRPGGWVGGGLQMGFDALRVELSAQHLFARRLQHRDDPGTGANVAITSARPGVCWTPRAGAFTLGGCAGVDIGAVQGDGFGLENNGRASSLWVAATPGLRAHWVATDRLALGLSLDVPIGLVRPTLTIDDFEPPLVRTGLTGVFAGLSFQFTFFDESRARRG